MKYLAIVLMPTQTSSNFFTLSALLKLSFVTLKAMRNDEEHIKYQLHTSTSLKEGYEFLQTLNVERDSTDYQAGQLMDAELNYAVLAVTDDFDVKQPLENFTRNIFLYYPDNHIHQALNAETEKNEELLKEYYAQSEFVNGNKKEDEIFEREFMAVVEKQEEIAERWKEYHECPLQSFKGPQFEEGLAKTPLLLRMSENYSPILKRTNSGEDLRAFYTRTETVTLQLAPGLMFQRKEKGKLRREAAQLPNDNNANDNNAKPEMRK